MGRVEMMSDITNEDLEASCSLLKAWCQTEPYASYVLPMARALKPMLAEACAEGQRRANATFRAKLESAEERIAQLEAQLRAEQEGKGGDDETEDE